MKRRLEGVATEFDEDAPPAKKRNTKSYHYHYHYHYHVFSENVWNNRMDVVEAAGSMSVAISMAISHHNIMNSRNSYCCDNDEKNSGVILESRLNRDNLKMARMYYQNIVYNSDHLSFEQTRQTIYDDLVFPIIKKEKNKEMEKQITSKPDKPGNDNSNNSNNGNNGNNNNNNNNNNNENDENDTKSNLTYTIGNWQNNKNNNDCKIESLNWDKVSNVICVGRREECDIVLSKNFGNNFAISSIHLFILKINNKIIVIDGWSANGTHVIETNSNNNLKIVTYNNNDIMNKNQSMKNDENDEKEKENENNKNKNTNTNKNTNKNKQNNKNDSSDKNSKDNNTDHDVACNAKYNCKRNFKFSENNYKFDKHNTKHKILTFDMNERVCLILGGRSEHGFVLTINPKCCILCQENARAVVIEECGHCIMCHSCFDKYCNDKIEENIPITCPICRKIIRKSNANINIKNCAYDTQVM